MAVGHGCDVASYVDFGGEIGDADQCDLCAVVASDAFEGQRAACGDRADAAANVELQTICRNGDFDPQVLASRQCQFEGVATGEGERLVDSDWCGVDLNLGSAGCGEARNRIEVQCCRQGEFTSDTHGVDE